MSYLTDKYGSNAAAKAATTSPSKAYGAGTGAVNKSSSSSSASSSAAPAVQQTVVSTPTVTNSNNNSNPSYWDVINFNSDYYKNQEANNDYNGGTQAEWEANFGEDESNDYWDQYLAYQRQVEAAQKAAIQAAVDQSVNKLNAQKTTTAQDYADAYRQLYLNKMKSNKNINQQMAAQGVTGGASESTLLGLNTNYEDNLRQGKVAEQNALSELDQAIANAQLSGSIEAANAAATTGQNTANAYLTAWQQQLAADQAAAQLEASQNSENRGYAYQMAMSMMQSGAMPSDELLLNAGISKADAQTIVAKYVAAKSSKSSGTSSSGGSGGSTYDSLLSYAQQLANQKGKSTALAYLQDAYNSSAFDSVSGSKKNAYDSMVASIKGMF